jgi:CelD/BcsL family acetyltransferase involved in cellulose biosynthesis
MQEFRDCFTASRSLEKGVLFFVRNHGGDILGGAWLVWDQHRSYYLLVGMDRDRAERSAVPTLIWHLMCFTREALGLKWFDFDGADVPQIEKFARAFGGHLTPFFEVVSVSRILLPLWKMRQLL